MADVRKPFIEKYREQKAEEKARKRRKFIRKCIAAALVIVYSGFAVASYVTKMKEDIFLNSLRTKAESVYIEPAFLSDYSILDKYGFDSGSAKSNMMGESLFNQGLKSNTGATGVSQLMPHAVEEISRFMKEYRKEKFNKEVYASAYAACSELLSPFKTKYNYDVIKNLELRVKTDKYANHRFGCAMWAYYDARSRDFCMKYGINYSSEMTAAFYNWGQTAMGEHLKKHRNNWKEHLPNETKNHIRAVAGYNKVFSEQN